MDAFITPTNRMKFTYSCTGSGVIFSSPPWPWHGDSSIITEADAAQGIGGVDYLMTSETDGKDLMGEVG